MKNYGALQNYIEMHRTRAGLSRDELSVLVGVDPRSTIWRYEENQRVPDIEKLLALEFVLGAPAHELFAGVAAEVEEKLARRARDLLESLTDAHLGPELTVKIATLSKLAHPDDITVIPVCDEE